VINYSSGYVDVFLNGKLDGAEIKIIPFMRNDSLIVGTKDGISGRVTGLIYYKYPVSAMAIKYMYEKFKTGTPPKFPEDTSLFNTDIFKNSTYR
jgi:predicted transcriptional regulator